MSSHLCWECLLVHLKITEYEGLTSFVTRKRFRFFDSGFEREWNARSGATVNSIVWLIFGPHTNEHLGEVWDLKCKLLGVLRKMLKLYMFIIQQIFSLVCSWSKHVMWPNIPQLKLGNIQEYSPIFKTVRVWRYC